MFGSTILNQLRHHDGGRRRSRTSRSLQAVEDKTRSGWRYPHPELQTGYMHQRSANWFNQVHHIPSALHVCRIKLSKNFTLIQPRFYTFGARLAVTTWDINGERNVIGLPLKSAIVYKDPSVWDGFPCHLVDHNPRYTNKLIDEVAERVFDPVLAQMSSDECKIKPRSVRNQLIAVANDRRAFLIARGSGAHSGEHGTAECWKGEILIYKMCGTSRFHYGPRHSSPEKAGARLERTQEVNESQRCP